MRVCELFSFGFDMADLFLCKDMTTFYNADFYNKPEKTSKVLRMVLWWAKASVSLLRGTSARSETGNLTNSHYSLISIFFNQHKP